MALQAQGNEGPIFRGPELRAHFGGASLADRLSQAAAKAPDARYVFWSDGVETVATLGELDLLGRRMARALYALGVRPGDGVAVQMPNRLETAIAYRACFALGAVLTPVVHIYGASELAFILRQSRARVLIVPDRWRHIDFQARIGELGDCPDLSHVVVVGEPTLAGAQSWSKLMAADHDPLDVGPIATDATALLLYTSGTTADPKGVRHSSRSLLGELDQRLAAGDDPLATTFSAWPAGHIGGFGSLLNPQVAGGPAVLMDRWVPDPGVRLMADHRVQRTAGVPVFLNELLDAAKATGADLSALSGYMTGAANVPPSLVERASAAGIGVFRCYGSSEHPTVTASRPDDPLHARAYTDGAVLAGSEVRLLDDDDRDVAGVGEGEVITRGAELFAGYHDPSLNADAFVDGGWYRTGDIGRFEDGRLVITDRKKDIIIRGGENISSKEVEDVLARHPAVVEAAAFSTPHPRLGETVAIAVTLRAGASLDLDAVGAHFAAAGVARQKTPERLEIVDDFPRTPSGKVKKFELRKRFAVSSLS
jgi:acyl-CoA synthetase (AMP-forming)/AMP-acid ligase II